MRSTSRALVLIGFAVGVAFALALMPIWSIRGTGLAQACSCPRPPPPTEARDASVVVFLGKITDATPPPSYASARVTFAVERVYKGQVPATVVADTTASSACGLAGVAIIGARWLVYSRRDHLYLDACTRTKPVEEAGADIAALGDGYPPIAATPTPDAPPVPASRSCNACSHYGRGTATPAAAIVVLALAIVLRRRARRDVRAQRGH